MLSRAARCRNLILAIAFCSVVPAFSQMTGSDVYAPATYLTINNAYIDQNGNLVLQDQRTDLTSLPGYEGYLEVSINGTSTAGTAIIASTINRVAGCQSGSNSFGALSQAPGGNTQVF